MSAAVQTPRRKPQPARVPLPEISTFWAKWLTYCARGFLRRHFHTLRIARGGFPDEVEGFPLVIYLNHASWWDPLVCAFLKAEFFPRRTGYAPIEHRMLERYKFLQRAGFFGVQRGSARSAAGFLRTSAEILRAPENILFLTPQSRFADVRERPLRFANGIGHLGASSERALFLPLAIEYTFWEERLPEILVRFGPPVEIRAELNYVFTACDWTRVLESKLTDLQDRLSELSQFREPGDFRVLLHGRAGVSAPYDLWRWARARLFGRTFQKEHGNK